MRLSGRNSAIWFCVAQLLCVCDMRAQAVPTSTVSGIVFDSLGGTPLPGARVSIVGHSRLVTSDQSGRFRFDSVPKGTHLLVAEHPSIDSIGLAEIAVKLAVDGDISVVVAIPSFATLWHRACGGNAVPADSGILYGSVRDAISQKHLQNTPIAVSWVDLSLSEAKVIRQRRYTIDTRSDSVGSYIVCGVPIDVTLQALIGTADSVNPLLLQLPPRSWRVQRRDISVGVPQSNGATIFGIIRGTVRDGQNTPVANVQVSIDGVEIARTDSAGKFYYAKVSPGSRQIDLQFIGGVPTSQLTEVTAGKVSELQVSMERATTLDRVDIVSSLTREVIRSFEDRKLMGFGYIRDSTYVMQRPSLASVFREFPNVSMGREVTEPSISFTSGKGCSANYIVNGFRVDKIAFFAVARDEIAWVEVYPRASSLPREFMGLTNGGCGAVVIFTKHKVGK